MFEEGREGGRGRERWCSLSVCEYCASCEFSQDSWAGPGRGHRDTSVFQYFSQTAIKYFSVSGSDRAEI